MAEPLPQTTGGGGTAEKQLALRQLASCCLWLRRLASEPGGNCPLLCPSAVSPSPAANLPERQLEYWITVQKYREGKPFEEPFRLAREINFEKDYQVRLTLRSPQPSYLYILNQSPDDANPLQILFPSSTANGGSPLIDKNREIQIPEVSWFKFDAEQGTETLWVVWSIAAIPEFDSARKFANPADGGVISDVGLTESLRPFLIETSPDDLKIEKTDAPPLTVLLVSGKIIVHGIKLAHN